MSLETKTDSTAAVIAKAASGPSRRSADSVSEQTYQALFKLITSRQIEPGDVVEERRLAERFDVSRTPMRAAISRLLGEGVLQQLSNGVVVVREVGLTEYLELLALRLLLEVEAAGLAAPHIPLSALAPIEARLQAVLAQPASAPEAELRLDDDVHELVLKHCGNRSLAHFIAEIHRRISMRNLESRPERLLPACREHLALVKALQARDAAQARQAMASHLESVRAAYLRAAGILPA